MDPLNCDLEDVLHILKGNLIKGYIFLFCVNFIFCLEYPKILGDKLS